MINKDKIFNDVYAKNYKLIYLYCLSRTKNNVVLSEELTNDAFMRFYNHIIEDMNIESSIRLLYKIMRNLIVDAYRKDNTLKRNVHNVQSYYNSENDDMVTEYVAYDLTSAEEKISMKYNLDMVLNIVQSFRDVEIKIFTLYFIDGYKIREIEDMTDICENTIKTHIRNVRKKLVNKLGKEKIKDLITF